MTREYTPLFDYQEFCALLDNIQTLKLLSSQYRNNTEFYQKKIKQVCERVERDFCDNDRFFFGWVNGEPIQLEPGIVVTLNGDRKVIFVLLILNRRRELGLPIYQSDVEQFYKLCKQSHTVFPKRYFEGA